MKNQVLDFEELIESEFKKISKIPLNERIAHYAKWARHNKFRIIAGGIMGGAAAGLCYEFTQWMVSDSTTNVAVKDFIRSGSNSLENIASYLAMSVDDTISAFRYTLSNPGSVLANLQSAYKADDSPEILQLIEPLEQNLHLFESGKPARPAYEFATDMMLRLNHLKSQYDVSHGTRAWFYGWGLIATAWTAFTIAKNLKRWEDESYNERINNSKELSHKTKALLPQIYADLSAYEDRHIILGVAYRYLKETRDAETAFKFLTSMRGNADAFFKDLSDLCGDGFKTLKQHPLSVFDTISQDDLLGIVNAYSGANKGRKLLIAGEEPKERKGQFLSEKPVTFDSIGGYERLKNQLRIYALAIRDPYDAAMSGVELETGIILWGPPGTGKTLLAQAFIHEALDYLGDDKQKHWTQISGADIKSKWLGQSEQNVQALYSTARKNPPYIIFIDEGDVLFANRDETHEYNREVITQFLTEMGGARRDDRITTLVTTNRRESFDTASTRYGRLGTKICVELPDEYARRQIFDIHLNRLNRIALVEDLDYAALIQETNGFSGADIAGVIDTIFKQRYSKIKLEGAQPYYLATSHFIEAIRNYERSKKEKNPIGFALGAQEKAKK